MIPNVYFQHLKEKIGQNVLPFFLKRKFNNYALNNLSQTDKKYFDEINSIIKNEKKLPFEFNSQELLYFSRNPEENWLQYLIFRYKFRTFPREKIVSEFPIYVLIEPISTCNLRCTMCFQVDKTFTKKPYMGLMDMNFYKKIIDECASNGTKAITFASRGEPTLHPKLGEMLDYAKNKFLEIKVNTNATRLTKELSEKILDAEVNEVTYSVDESIKENYEKLRVRSNFEQILENIKRFQEIRDKKYPNSKTSTRISGVLVEDYQDKERITKFWEQYVDHVVFVKCQNRWDTYNNEKDDTLSPCDYLWERMYVWFDGITNPCDVDYKSFLSQGKLDYSKNSIKEIWSSERYNELRSRHLNKERNKINPCDRCGISF